MKFFLISKLRNCFQLQKIISKKEKEEKFYLFYAFMGILNILQQHVSF